MAESQECGTGRYLNANGVREDGETSEGHCRETF